MIIYDKNLKEGLAEFGIEIPIHHSRAARTFEKLKGHKILGPKIDQWFISSINETITRKDLLRVHSMNMWPDYTRISSKMRLSEPLN